MIATLIAVFVLSGAAGLIYESIWTRYLGLFVGHSAYAQIIVLVVFLGGMSLGAHLAAQRSASLRSPLLWYAAVEYATGMIGLFFHSVFVAVTSAAYDSIFPALHGPWVIVAKWLIASALILPQSILLGATFPLMSAGVIRIAGAQRSGRMLALLYFANSIGAAAGVLVAGLVLVASVGLPGTLMVAACTNVLVAVIAGLIARVHNRSGRELIAPVPSADVDSASASYGRQLLWVAFGTAVASFVYEIAWIRMLSLVLGSATHSFEIMLSAFILGLALGSWWIRHRADAADNPLRLLGMIQWAMGILAVATMPLYVASFDWTATLFATVQRNDDGYRAFIVARYLMSLVIMLPATFCAGMTLPLITRELMRGRAGERAIGMVYAVNTLGSIVGVVTAGLILMPLLGLKRLLVLGACIDIGLGVWLIVSDLLRRRRLDDAAPRMSRGLRRWTSDGLAVLTLPLIATVVLLVTAAASWQFDLGRLTSGVYRHGVVTKASDYTFPFYRDGRTATVSVRRDHDGFTTLATNGKPDASMDRVWMDTTAVPQTARELTLTRDISSQFLLPIMTLAHAPRGLNAAVIGHGSGMSSHVLLGSPYFRQVVTIEIEPEMIRGSRNFMPTNRRVFEDPRSLEVIDDAKSYFASSSRKFDLIMSEPSNPWVSGVSGLFTREFYARVKHQLTEHGVFGQWLHLYEVNDQLVTSVLLAIDAEFADYQVFYTSNSDVLIVAANSPLPQPDWGVTNYPGIAHDLRHALPLAPEWFESLRLGGRNVLHPMLLSQGYVNSDYFPILDLGAERMRFARENAAGYIGLADRRFDLVAALTGRRADFSTVAYSPVPEIGRSVARALGARIRRLRAYSTPEGGGLPLDEDLRKALYRVEAFDHTLTAARAPADWHVWVNDLVAVDADLHGGTAGVVDTAFFKRVRAFLDRTNASAEPRAAVSFLHGTGSWNWREIADVERTLTQPADAVEWLPDSLLRPGLVTARIKLGDYEQAKVILRAFAARYNAQHFDEQLIAAYLAFSDPASRRRLGWQ